MKKNDWLLLISVLLYSLLFYKQSAGINFLIFNSSIVALLLYRNSALIRSKVWLSVAAGALLSSFFIFMYGSALAIWANMLSLFILSAISIDPATSFLTAIFLTVCSAGSSCVFMFIDWVRRKKQEVSETYKRPFYVKMFLILIPFLIALLFFFFYQNANPLFYNFTKDINLDFISIGWIFFTCSGLLLMYGFFHNRRIRGISDVDVNAALTLTPEAATRKNFLNGLMRLDTEAISGLILFSMLNLLLLLLNVLDLHYLWFDGTLPQGIKHKEFVHDGIGTLILSIIVAIIILLFYFRGGLNFYRQSKWLRVMAYAWIIQNAFMIFSCAYRNNMYIQESGLSYKKIGVYVYLIFVLVGLLTTFIKVWKIKTNWYLFRTNAAIYYYLLVISCVFNWDVIITDFNIKKNTEEHKELEKYLLLDLSYKNLPQLLSLPDSIAGKDDYNARDYYYALRGVYFKGFKPGLDEKLYLFLNDYSTLEWPSFCYEKRRVYNDIYKMKDQVHSLSYENAEEFSLKPLQLFTDLQSLTVNNTPLPDLGDLKYFTKLQKLSLENDQIDSLDEFTVLPNLRELKLAGNDFENIQSLSRLKNIEFLDISGQSHIKNFEPLLSMPKLKHLMIGSITPEDLEALKVKLPNVIIQANVINTNNSRE